MPVPLQLCGDDLPGLGEGRHYLSHGLDRHVGTVEHDKRLSGAVDLVVHPEAVDLGVAASTFTVHFVSFRGYPRPRAQERGA